ncbi:hypothetical protein HanRHA438_Chr04g0155811 [Helianthus annuus]|nr:hypothetical protein HanIR_Chr04g0156821 [Helianthus annuus]KAJ0925100.1 hypothetical protein HanRHA438_Chr04g0155811 [Helianthus annuus]
MQENNRDELQKGKGKNPTKSQKLSSLSTIFVHFFISSTTKNVMLHFLLCAVTCIRLRKNIVTTVIFLAQDLLQKNEDILCYKYTFSLTFYLTHI